MRTIRINGKRVRELEAMSQRAFGNRLQGWARTTDPDVCRHNPNRLYTWHSDGKILVSCNDCGKVLHREAI